MKIFISYRRKSWGFTHRLDEEIRRTVDVETFVDYTGIDQADFEKSILGHLQTSDVVLLVLTELTFAPDRINQEGDWVRREIRTALEADKPIVLARVDGILPPPPGDLPEDIRRVTRMQGIAFYAEFFEAAVQQLVKFLLKIAEPSAAATAHPVTAPMPVPSSQPESQPAAFSPTSSDTFSEAVRLFEGGDYEKAVFLFTQLRDAGYKTKSKILTIDAYLEDAKNLHAQVARQREANVEYQEIALAAQSKNRQILRRAKSAWTMFRRKYPDYLDDPENLAERLENITLSMTLPELRAPFMLPLLEWCRVPPGKVTIEGKVYQLEAFNISKYPVTNAQFQAFVDAQDGYQDAEWWNFSEFAKLWRGKNSQPAASMFKGDKRPRENVCWFEAVAFARWLSAKTDLLITLPTEGQWQRAAQGDDRREYPWGIEFDTEKCNAREGGIRQTTNVDRYQEGVSPFGVFDLSGNVWEWCLNEYEILKNKDLDSDMHRTVRGGSYGSIQELVSVRFRTGMSPDTCSGDQGMRLVLMA